MRDVILHAFDWKLSDISTRAQQIALNGFGAVLIPPPLYTYIQGTDWWQRYQPKDYRILRSYLGRKADIISLIKVLHSAGLKVYADIVFNHMANEKSFPERQNDPYNFPGEAELQKYKDNSGNFAEDRLYGDLSTGLFSPGDFNPQGDITDWENPGDVENRWLNGLPDLYLNDWVVEQQRECLRALNVLGFDGYRVDAMKHLPIQHIKAVFQTDDLKDKYVFGETLTFNDQEEAAFLWPIIHETIFPCYDFPLQETMRNAFAFGGSLRELVNPSAYGKALNWSRAVTVTVTHDIPNNDGFRGLIMNPQDEYLANAYILGRDGGVPMVYSDNNQSAAKYPEDMGRWINSWNRMDISSMVRFHNAVHGSQQYSLFEDDGYFIFARGEMGIVAINKTDSWQSASFSTTWLRQGKYRCTLHGYEINLQEEYFLLSIPPRQAQMWLYEE
jgi:alpha-amylase